MCFVFCCWQQLLLLYFLWPWLLLWPSYNLDLVPFRDYYHVRLIIWSLLVIISSLFSSPPWVPGQIMPPVRLYLPHWEDSQHASYFLFSFNFSLSSLLFLPPTLGGFPTRIIFSLFSAAFHKDAKGG